MSEYGRSFNEELARTKAETVTIERVLEGRAKTLAWAREAAQRLVGTPTLRDEYLAGTWHQGDGQELARTLSTESFGVTAEDIDTSWVIESGNFGAYYDGYDGDSSPGVNYGLLLLPNGRLMKYNGRAAVLLESDPTTEIFDDDGMYYSFNSGQEFLNQDKVRNLRIEHKWQTAILNKIVQNGRA